MNDMNGFTVMQENVRYCFLTSIKHWPMRMSCYVVSSSYFAVVVNIKYRMTDSP